MSSTQNSPLYTWSRPPIPENFDNSSDFVFQVIDIDNYLGSTPYYIDTEFKDYGSIVRLFGVTKNGNTVLVHCYGFRPYFYIESPSEFDETFLERFTKKLNEELLKDSNKSNTLQRAVLSVSLESKSNLYGYTSKPKPFLKITVSTQFLINPCIRLLENNIKLFFENRPENFYIKVYEANIDFEIRFLIDQDISGCNWIKFNNNCFHIRTSNRSSNCQIEIDVSCNNTKALSSDEDCDSIAPYKILSYDIECSANRGSFPEPEKDPIIQIGNTLTEYGNENETIKVIFTLKSCAPIVGALVISSETEKEMLEKWADFVIQSDPDIITGYNIFNFDTPYIIERSKHLKVTKPQYLGRMKSIISTIKLHTFENKAFGKRENKYVNISGRLQLDVLQILFREHKLRSYSLNNVSFHFLGEQKEDVHHSIISELQNGDEHTRRRLAVYCLKDSLLPLRLLDKLMIITNHIEMSRVTGVPYNYLLERGQQVKVISQLLRSCKIDNYVIPTMKVQKNSDDREGYEGATVIDPEKGFYNIPIATLDFMSLYPSIMISNNLCYSTLITNNSETIHLSPDDYTIAPSGHKFVKPHIRQGILPCILQNLLDARKHVKQLMKTEKDPQRYKVYDGRQLAIKMSANSVYGFTGAQVGKLPCLEISSNVTAYGRNMIESTKDLIEKHFCCSNGYPTDANVIYGDTDSVMVNFRLDDIAKVMSLAREAADLCSSKFQKPVRLEFEKVYSPYLLISKKRYAGLLYTRPEKYDKIDCKGIETVRRDNCLLVSNLLNSCLHNILIERSTEAAVKTAIKAISDLLMNRIDLSFLIISKELRNTHEKYKGKQAHAELAERMRKRDPGSAPKLGDRVPFVYIRGTAKDKAYEKAEDPIYVLENNIQLDTKYYLENQLAKPLTRLFEPILKSKTESILFKGEHTLNKAVLTSSVGSLSKFTKRVFNCVGCKSSMENQAPLTPALCKFCDTRYMEYYLMHINQINDLQKNCNSLWTECQRCQGSYTQEVICTNRDCPIFYMRTKAAKDLRESQKILNRFKFTVEN